jgi:hypothetical protein
MDTLVKFLSDPIASVFQGNIVHAVPPAVASSKSVDGITVKDPVLVRKDGFLLPKGKNAKGLGLVRLTANDVGPDKK